MRGSLRTLEMAVRTLWTSWRLLVGACTIVLVLSVVYIVSLPRTYTSEIILLPEVASTGGLSGSMGSLASLAGIKVGDSGEDAVYPEFYPKVLSSTPFVLDLFDVPVILEDGREIRLYEYMEKYQKQPWWAKMLIWSKSDDEENIPVKEGVADSSFYVLTKKENRVAIAIKGMVSCRVDKKTDMVTIDVEMQDAVLAAYMADVIKEKLQRYIVDYRTSKARNDAAYMEQITSESRANYLEAQRKYASFADSYQGLTLEAFSQKKNRLENEMDLAYTAYSQAFQQLQLAKAKVQEHTPVFVTIQPAVVPLRPSGPKRMVFVFMMGVLSFLCVSSWILIKDYYRRSRLVIEEMEGGKDEN